MGDSKEKVYIKVSEYGDKSGAKIDFYDKDPKKPDHKSIHVKIDYEKKSYTTVDNVKGEKENTSGNCFLTSACMSYSQEIFDDNCYELRVLRWFRDNFVSPEDIAHYYQTTPIIVEGISKHINNGVIYDYIYHKVIKVCVEAIENNNYKLAYDRYRSSILALEEQFARKEYEKKLVKILRQINII